MAYEKRDNSGSLFRNKRKEKESHPDYQGQAVIDGREYWISAWLKTAQSGDNAGEKFFSFAFKKKDQQTQQFEKKVEQNFGPGAQSRLNDDVPF